MRERERKRGLQADEDDELGEIKVAPNCSASTERFRMGDLKLIVENT